MWKQIVLILFSCLLLLDLSAQTNPAITDWIINTTGITGRHYVEGNSTPITDNYPANVQTVQYSSDYVYVSASGIPGYIVGPYLDGNPALATDNGNIYKIPLNPVENTGTATQTGLGVVGVFINGVAIYDWQDGASYSVSSGTDEMMSGDGVWNRDAIVAENDGFDCAKGHPSPIFSGMGPGGTLEGGFYHHHQNPSAFNLDLVEVSDVCDLYLADGLYTIDSTVHSPLIGFAYDGFPVYGAYGYANTDGTGGIKRMESSYALRTITARTEYADGTDVTDGPAVSANFPLGWYVEDYEYIASSGDLDDHNGRFCITPEYPDGIYAYFATVDADWNSAYPYMIGSYYGVVEGENVTTITETVTTYDPMTSIKDNLLDEVKVTVFPNPANELLAIQVEGTLRADLDIKMYDIAGKLIKDTRLNQGSTIAHLDLQTVYEGNYVVQISNGTDVVSKHVVIRKD